jgi:hypothetical protein
LESIAIVGCGIAALQLALFLQQRGVSVALHSDRTPDELRASRLPNTVVRFESTRARERALGVNHWDDPAVGIHSVHFRIHGTPIAFRGDFSHPASFLDMRLYQSKLLDDFAARGGEIVYGTVQVTDLPRLAENHSLVVVATGRGRLADQFPHLPEHSPYTQPQRRLFAGLFHGIRPLEPHSLAFTIVPGHGEIFNAAFASFDGLVSNLLIEAIPGGELEPLMDVHYQDDPKRFHRAVLETLREYAPTVYDRVETSAFGLTRPLDLHKGAITPIVRRGYIPLGADRFAIAIGDAHIQNDPILGQGANAASYAAHALGTAIVSGGPFDEAFCQGVEDAIWDYTRNVSEWSVAALQPPPPHVEALFGVATEDKAVADQLIENFGAPDQAWPVFKSVEGAAAFLSRFGHSLALDQAPAH